MKRDLSFMKKRDLIIIATFLLIAVVGLAAFRLSGDGVQRTPGLPSGIIDLSLFLFGKLLIRDEIVHICNLLAVF